MERKKSFRSDAPLSPWWDQVAVRDAPIRSESIPWTREYNVQTAVVEAEHCARQTRVTILWSGTMIDGVVVLVGVVYGGILLGFQHSKRDAELVNHEVMVLSRVVGVVSLLVILMNFLRCILIVWGIQYASAASGKRHLWTLAWARYCTVKLMFLYGTSSLLLLLFWNTLHLDGIRSFLNEHFLHSYWMIPLPWARCTHRHSQQLYLPLLVLCMIEVIRYRILRSYTESLSPPRDEEEDVQHTSGTVGPEEDAVRAPLLSSPSNAPVARWWNSDYWTTTASPRHRPSTADLVHLHDAWARRSELEGPLWWSRDEEDIECDLLSTTTPVTSIRR